MSLYLYVGGVGMPLHISDRVTSLEHARQYVEKYYHYTYARVQNHPYGQMAVFTEDGEKMGMYHYFLLTPYHDKGLMELIMQKIRERRKELRQKQLNEEMEHAKEEQNRVIAGFVAEIQQGR